MSQEPESRRSRRRDAARSTVPGTPSSTAPASVVLLVGVAFLALLVRYEDPLSTPVMATEDPYTHLVFTREHMERGHFGDSFHMGTTLYPPGMHALLGIFWTMSDVDLYQFMRLGAPFLGAFAAVGTFLLAHRFGGLPAGVTAGVVIALIPEHVLRTNVFFPTALDLALVPFYLWAIMEAVDGRSGGRVPWLVVAGVIGGALAVAHPWIIPVTAAPIALYVLARAVAARASTTTLKRAALAAVVPVALLALAVRTRWKQSGSGLGDISGSFDGELFLLTLAAVLNVYTLGVLVLGGGLVALLGVTGRKRAAAVAASVSVALALFVTVPVLAAYPPAHVDYGLQLGWPAMALAVAGAVALPLWRDNRVGQMGAAIALVTFPVTAVNLFQSPYLPHRTVAYLAIGVAFLAGGLAAYLAHRLGAAEAPTTSHAHRAVRIPRVAMSALVAVAVAGLMLGPASAKPEHWYRYYTPAQYEGFQAAEKLLEADPNAVVLSGDWRPNMMLKTFTPDLDRAWYSEDYFFSEEARWDWHGRAADSGLTLYVLVERYEHERFGDAHWASDLTPVWTCSCKNMVIYRAAGG